MGVAGERITTIHNGCDARLFARVDREQARRRLGVPAEERVIVFAGRLELTKGLMELLQAAMELREQYPTLRLVCIGDGPAQQPMQKHAGAEASWLQFTGALEAAE